jgi:hypothetical protein
MKFKPIDLLGCNAKASLYDAKRYQKYRDIIYGDNVSSWYSRGPEGKPNSDAL